MDVNLIANSGANRIAPAVFTDPQEVPAAVSDHLEGGVIRGPSLRISEGSNSAGIQDMLELSQELDLSRDDRLGSLVMSAFDLKPPESPEFV